ncbi:MAG: DUF502 domain-containing protein [Candidatus Marinimicrobia bacterium]|nr:DUF502 domain-containing protein [Candidatus Neomarinimicrobiota bacterium]
MKINIKRAVISGLVTTVPFGITIFVLMRIFIFFDNLLPEFMQKLFPFNFPGFGIILSFLFIVIVGAVANNYLGKTALGWVEKIVIKIPLFGKMYNTFKGLIGVLNKDSSKEFKKVVWLEYPTKGIWTIGFVTGNKLDANDNKMYSIFLPTTPNPTSGFALFIYCKDVIETDYTIEEGLKILMSAGMISPKKLQIKPKEY